MSSVTMGQLQKKLDTISHNLANVNTQGYKRREATFSDLLFQQVNNQSSDRYEEGRLTPNGIRVGSGAKIGQTALRIEQGSLQSTDRPLDVAITQKGHFFQIGVNVDGALETRYTRDGAFYFSPVPGNEALLNLVTQDGDYVLGQGGPITIPANHSEIQISNRGTITARFEDGTTEQVGQLELVNVERPQMLVQMGQNNFGLPGNLAELGYVAADILGVIPNGQVSVEQNMLEMSNVNLQKEMNDLMLAQRSYQFNSRSISMADQMMGLVNGIRG